MLRGGDGVPDQKTLKSNVFSLFKVLIAVVALALLVSLLSVRILRTAERTAIGQFNKMQTAHAKEVAAGIEQYFSTLKHEQLIITEALTASGFDEPQSRRLFQSAYKRLRASGVNDIALLGEDGRLRIAAKAPLMEGRDFSWRGYFKRAKRNWRSRDLNVEFIEFQAVARGQKGLAVAMPISAPGSGKTSRFSGVLLFTVELNYLTRKFVAPVKASAGGHALLLDQESIVLWAPDKDLFGRSLVKQAGGSIGEKSTIKKMLSGRTGAVAGPGPLAARSARRAGRESTLLAYAPIRFGNVLWAVGIEAPRGDAMDTITSTIGQLLMLSVAIGVIILGGGGYVFLLTSRSAARHWEAKEQFRQIAESVQDALIRPLPEIEGLKVAAAYAPAYAGERIGGDFYDIFALDNGTIIVIIGDVAGKGVAAAGLAETVRSAARTLARLNLAPHAILAELNATLLDQIAAGGFVTALCVAIDPARKQAAAASAGHYPPLILTDRPALARVENGMPLGIKGARYPETAIDLSAANGIVVFTDGLIEARRGAELFGEAAVLKLAAGCRPGEARELVDQLMEAAQEFAAGKLNDDAAVLALCFDLQPAGSPAGP